MRILWTFLASCKWTSWLLSVVASGKLIGTQDVWHERSSTNSWCEGGVWKVFGLMVFELLKFQNVPSAFLHFVCCSSIAGSCGKMNEWVDKMAAMNVNLRICERFLSLKSVNATLV